MWNIYPGKTHSYCLVVTIIDQLKIRACQRNIPRSPFFRIICAGRNSDLYGDNFSPFFINNDGNYIRATQAAAVGDRGSDGVLAHGQIGPGKGTTAAYGTVQVGGPRQIGGQVTILSVVSRAVEYDVITSIERRSISWRTNGYRRHSVYRVHRDDNLV